MLCNQIPISAMYAYELLVQHRLRIHCDCKINDNKNRTKNSIQMMSIGLKWKKNISNISSFYSHLKIAGIRRAKNILNCVVVLSADKKTTNGNLYNLVV